jgi:Periplasmic binding protein-like domain
MDYNVHNAPFHGGNTGSNPVRVATSVCLVDRAFVRLPTLDESWLQSVKATPEQPPPATFTLQFLNRSLPGVKYRTNRQVTHIRSNSMKAGIASDPALARFLGLASVPTAVLASNNSMAIGFLRAARKRGMDVPSHFALACFDRIEVMDLIKPTVTAAIQPAYSFGTIATQLLLEKLREIPVENQRTGTSVGRDPFLKHAPL